MENHVRFRNNQSREGATMKFKTVRHQFPGIAVGTIALSVSVHSLAQDAVDTDVSESARTLEEIVVTV